MTKVEKLIFVLTTIITAQGEAYAQSGINSPYSRYGYGLLSDCSLGFNKGMAGVSQGFRGSQEINIKNPASYSSVDSLTALFDIGMSVQAATLDMGQLRQNTRNAMFDYLAFHFRATKGLGITAAVLPVSRINYSFAKSGIEIEADNGLAKEDVPTQTTSYTGEGGLRKAVFGIGYQLPFFKQMNFGVNAGYLWGEYEHTAQTSYSNTSAFPISRIYSANISTYTLDFGMQFSQKLDKEGKNRLTIGGTYTLGHNIPQPAYRTTTLTDNSSISYESVELENALSLPHSFAVGASYNYGNKLRVGADFEMQMWSKAKFPAYSDYTTEVLSENVLNDMKKYSLGAEYTPNIYSRNFFNKIAYKIGGYYSNSYANADETGTLTKKPTEFGLTAGFTIPLSNRNLFHATPKINVSFAWIHSDIPTRMGTATSYTDSSLKENYYRLSVGITISERWFYKWKVQ